MMVNKRVKGYAVNLGDLKQFIVEAEKEGFDDDTKLNPRDPNANPPFGVLLYVHVGNLEDPNTQSVTVSDYEGRCRECLNVVPSDKFGIALLHYRGETEHPDAKCYGMGKKVSGLVKR